jgi:DNA-binding Lrp family transcriptional regulator
MKFTETERAVLRIVQRDLPDSLTPFADIAEQTGMSEEDVIALLRGMKEGGAISQFGASVKHQKAGYTHNAMVAWKITPEHVDGAGKAAAKNKNVSHCYYRPSDAPDWPYTLYTMVHGRTKEECEAAIAELSAIPHMTEPATLSSLKELKKISMTYF